MVQFVPHRSVFFELFFKVCHLRLTVRLEDLLGLLIAKTTLPQELSVGGPTLIFNAISLSYYLYQVFHAPVLPVHCASIRS